MQKMKKKLDSLWAIYLITSISFIILLYCLFRMLQSNNRSLALADDGQLILESKIVIRRKRNGLKKSTNRLWNIYKDKHNDWVVPYTLKKGAASEILNQKEKDAIIYVMALIMGKTCLRFMEKEEWRKYPTSGGTAAKEWLEIHKDHLGCLTHTGRNKQRPMGNNTIHFKPHCIIRHTHKPNYQKISRLLLTALGVDLEHRRNDRSTFVTINQNNIREAKRNNVYFEKNNPVEFDNYDIDYNFLSVMHDKKNTWGRKVNGKSMTVISPNTGYETFEDTMGTVEYPSDNDYELLNKMYECNKKSSSHGVITSSKARNSRPSKSNSAIRSSGGVGENNGGGGRGNGGTGLLSDILGHAHHILNNKLASGGSEEDSSSSEEDKDKAGDCEVKKFLCMDRDYAAIMAVMCKATCNIKGGVNKYKPDCFDVGDKCRQKFSECDHSDTYDAMTMECPHTCGRCEQHRLMMSAPAPGFMNRAMSPMMGVPMMTGYNPMMEPMMGGMPPQMMNPMIRGMGGLGIMGGMNNMAYPSTMVAGVMHPQLMQPGMTGKRK